MTLIIFIITEFLKNDLIWDIHLFGIDIKIEERCFNGKGGKNTTDQLVEVL